MAATSADMPTVSERRFCLANQFWLIDLVRVARRSEDDARQHGAARPGLRQRRALWISGSFMRFRSTAR